MGVKDLWTILSPTCERKSLYDLQGKAIAVDLSCWVVEDQSVGVYSTQPRMYLRNLFFRTTCLLMLNVKPVFVLEGDAPKLKHDTMARRNEAQQLNHRRLHGSSQSQPTQSQPTQSQNNAKKGTRTRLKSLLKQCETMLHLMGVSCVQSVGEAEALCGQLNAAGLVEGCITQDGDCFLYGATKVYRNFTISAAGAGGSASAGFSVDVFEMCQIGRHLALGRRHLVALALLLGCDYVPGVAGVGKVNALAFLANVGDDNVIDRMHRWRTDPYFEELELDPKGLTYKTPEQRKAIIAELNIRKKALEDPDFPSREVVSEFLDLRPLPESLDLDWHEPDLPGFIRLAAKLMAWTETYAVEKFFPLVARWQVAHLAATRSPAAFAFAPADITKKRVQKGVASFELRWLDKESFLSTLTLDEDKTPGDLLVSVEPQSLVEQAYPLLVEKYNAQLLAKKLGKKKPSRKGKENVDTQPRIDTFLKPCEDATASLHLSKPSRPAKPAGKKPVKKPLVTIASLMKQMAAIEGNKAATQRAPTKSKSPRKQPVANYLSCASPTMSPIPTMDPIAGGKRVNRFASPRLKVGLKTRKMSTPGKCPSIRELERSFRNVSLVDYSEDDDEFSDLSAIIDGIVGFSDDGSECEDVSAAVGRRFDVDCGLELAGENCVEAKASKEIPENVLAVDSESDDEFDFCDLKFVPLHVKVGMHLT